MNLIKDSRNVICIALFCNNFYLFLYKYFFLQICNLHYSNDICLNYGKEKERNRNVILALNSQTKRINFQIDLFEFQMFFFEIK